MSGYTTPIQVRIKTYNNMSRIDSGKNPFPNRYENSYHAEDYKDFKQDYKNEKINNLIINYLYRKPIENINIDELVDDLRNIF